MFKKARTLLLCLCLVLSLAACGSSVQPTESTQPAKSYEAGEGDIALLDAAYEGRSVYHGEFHDHASTGGTSDGHQNLTIWKNVMDSLEIDFATIVDHRQILHMELDLWDDTIFIGGSEAGAMPTGLSASATGNKMHMNLIFATSEDFVKTIEAYDALYPNRGFLWQEYSADYAGADADKLAGGWHYTPLYYDYNAPSKEQVAQLVSIIRENNGMFVHVHPKSNNYIVSENPEDYWFADYTGLEVFYGFSGYAPQQPATQRNYQLWVTLLGMGKKIWATAGSDQHDMPNTNALTTVYSEAKRSDAHLSHIRVGDAVCGPVGIRMTIGDATMGGETAFAGQRVVFSVGDFHKSAYDETHTYRVELHSDTGILFSQVLTDPNQTAYFALDADVNAAFYRVEIHDETSGLMHALGNPIWNVK